MGESDFALAIAQPDDVVRSRKKMQPTLRDNVLFELGLFMGKLTRHRAILIHPRVIAQASLRPSRPDAFVLCTRLAAEVIGSSEARLR